MAEKIKASDLIDKDVLTELLKVEKAIKGVTKSTADLMAVMQKQNEVLKQGATNQKTVSDNVKKNEDNTRKLSDVEKEIQKIEEKHYQVLTKMVAARSEEARALEKATRQAKDEELQRKASVNSINGLIAANQRLKNQRNDLIITDKNYKKNLEEINKKIDENDKIIKNSSSALEKQKLTIGNYKAVWGGVVGIFGKVVSGLAAIGISSATFHKIIGSSTELTDKYEAVMSGLNTATKAFFVTIRDGDWSNLIDNLKNAYERGVKYQELMDALSKTERANNIVLKEKREAYLTLRETLMDETKSNKERLKAGEDALKMVKENYDAQKILVDKQIDAQALLLNLKTGENLTDKQKIENTRLIMEAYKNMDTVEDDTRLKAEEINKELAYQNELLKLNRVIPLRTDAVEEEEKAYLKEINTLSALTDKYHIFAAVLRVVEQKKSPESIQKYLDLLSKQAEADAAYQEENKRMIQTVGKVKNKDADDDKKRLEQKKKDEAEYAKQREMYVKGERQMIEESEKEEEVRGVERAKTMEEIDRQYYEAKIKADEETQKRLDASYIKDRENYLREQELKRQIDEETTQLKIESANAVFDIASGFMNREIQGLEEKKQKEIDGAGDNAKKKERIEAEYNKKIGAIKRKQAIAEKAQGIFNIGINTAIAIMKNNAQLGTVLAAPINAWTRVLAALQIAAIMAQPIPKFFKGVRGFKGGLATVGDPNGQTKDSFELVETPKGSFLTPNKATEMLLPKGTNVYSHRETIEKLNNMHPSVANELLKEQKLTRKALANQVHHSTKIDEGGARFITTYGNSTTEWINKNFR